MIFFQLIFCDCDGLVLCDFATILVSWLIQDCTIAIFVYNNEPPSPSPHHRLAGLTKRGGVRSFFLKGFGVKKSVKYKFWLSTIGGS